MKSSLNSGEAGRNAARYRDESKLIA